MFPTPGAWCQTPTTQKETPASTATDQQHRQSQEDGPRPPLGH